MNNYLLIKLIIVLLPAFFVEEIHAQIEFDTTYQISQSGDTTIIRNVKPLLTFEDTLNKRINYLLNRMGKETATKKEIFNDALTLMEYPNSFFQEEQKEKLRQVFKDSLKINTALILLTGKIGLNDKKTQESLLKQISVDTLGNFNYKINGYSKEWCSHLAMAKMGHKDHQKFIKSIIQANDTIPSLLNLLYSHLVYVGNEMAISILMDYSSSEGIYDCYTDEGYGTYLKKRSCQSYFVPGGILLSILDSVPINSFSSEENYKKTERFTILKSWIEKHRNNYKLKTHYLEEQIMWLFLSNLYFRETEDEEWAFKGNPNKIKK